jgi:hypothetical protein
VSDANASTLITQAESEVDRLLNTTFSPKRVAERHVPENNKEFVMLRRTPVTRVVRVTVGTGTNVDVDGTVLDPISGKLYLTSYADSTTFSSNEDRGNTIDYYYAKLDESATETTLSSATGTGTSVTVTVGSCAGFSANDYVRIVDPVAGKPEITKVISVGTGTFSADLSWRHASGSRAVKMQVPEDVRQVVRITAALMAARYMIGANYTFATSYTFPEEQVTKGSPLQHFGKVYETLVQQRDELLKRLRPQAAIG